MKNLKEIGELLISKGANMNAKDILYLKMKIYFLISGLKMKIRK